MAIPPRTDCARCHHVFHADGPCQTKTVTGPPSDHPAREGDHGIRTVTECDCKVALA